MVTIKIVFHNGDYVIYDIPDNKIIHEYCDHTVEAVEILRYTPV